ncbi:MAG: phage integrase N-terminal SAM-like domain-containing protein [Thermosynechococcaceae cyanobacterium]
MPPTKPQKILDQVRDVMRTKHYAYRIEETYMQWICRFILFHNKRHPKEIAEPEVEAFLTHLPKRKPLFQNSSFIQCN